MPIGSIVGGLISKGGSDAAAGAYGEGVKNADFIRRQNEAKFSPWWQSGYGADNVLSGALGLGHLTDDGQGAGGVRLDGSDIAGDQANALSRFKTSPDYNFRLDQGIGALDRSAASKGMLLSGAQTKGVQQYGSDLASGEYGNWINRLMGVSGQGLTAAQGTAASNSNALAQGNAAYAGQGSAYQSGANALAGGIMNGVKSAASLFAGAGGIGGMSSYSQGLSNLANIGNWGGVTSNQVGGPTGYGGL